jgi:hypothetical protein
VAVLTLCGASALAQSPSTLPASAAATTASADDAVKAAKALLTLYREEMKLALGEKGEPPAGDVARRHRDAAKDLAARAKSALEAVVEGHPTELAAAEALWLLMDLGQESAAPDLVIQAGEKLRNYRNRTVPEVAKDCLQYEVNGRLAVAYEKLDDRAKAVAARVQAVEAARTDETVLEGAGLLLHTAPAYGLAEFQKDLPEKVVKGLATYRKQAVNVVLACPETRARPAGQVAINYAMSALKPQVKSVVLRLETILLATGKPVGEDVVTKTIDLAKLPLSGQQAMPAPAKPGKYVVSGELQDVTPAGNRPAEKLLCWCEPVVIEVAEK